MPRKFIKKTEDFVCGHCGREVKGNGYTNHCPFCLWSKHVDIDPGDRLAQCEGLMKPADIYFKNQAWIIVHRCLVCGEERRKKVEITDDFGRVIEIEKEINEKKVKG